MFKYTFIMIVSVTLLNAPAWATPADDEWEESGGTIPGEDSDHAARQVARSKCITKSGPISKQGNTGGGLILFGVIGAIVASNQNVDYSANIQKFLACMEAEGHRVENIPGGKKPAINSSGQETVLWQSVESLGSVDAYRVYLEQYPAGTYAGIAKLKIASISGNSSASAAGENRQTRLTEPSKPTENPSSVNRPRGHMDGSLASAQSFIVENRSAIERAITAFYLAEGTVWDDNLGNYGGGENRPQHLDKIHDVRAFNASADTISLHVSYNWMGDSVDNVSVFAKAQMRLKIEKRI